MSNTEHYEITKKYKIIDKNNNVISNLIVHHLPPELWWKIGLYANEILTIRSINKDIYILHPERVLVANRWSWLADVTKNDYNNMGEYLSDLQLYLEDCICPTYFTKSSNRIKYNNIRPITRTHVFRKILSNEYSFGNTYMDKLNNLMKIMNLDDKYTDIRRVHEVYKVRGATVHILRRKNRNVLSLIY